MKDIVFQLVSAFLGSLGFGMVYGMRRRFLFAAALGAALSWGVFLITQFFLNSYFFCCLLAAAFAVVYAELLAKKLKTPATLFVIPSVLPLVPGRSLYQAMSFAVRGDMAAARSYGARTAEAALAIAAGLSFVMAVRELRSRKS